MSDGGATLTINYKGYVFWDGVRLPMRYEHGKLEFVIKRPQDRERLKAKRIKVPLDEFKRLERRRCEGVGNKK